MRGGKLTLSETEKKIMAKKTTAVANSEKKDIMLSHSELLEMVQLATVGCQCKVFTDNANYVGVGKKANGFSVNVKKTKYNVFCNDDNYSMLVESKQFTDCTFTKNGNSSDKTRPHAIEVKATDSLKAMLSMVLHQFYNVDVAKDTN